MPRRGGRTGGAFDRGLLSPVTAQSDAGSGLDDAAFARCLVAAEVALTRAWAELGVAPVEAAEAVSAAFGIGPEAGVHGDTRFAVRPADDALSQAEIARLSAESASGGNPVIPLVALMRDRVPEHARGWVHRGATSQDIMDTALMLLAQDAISGVLVSTEWAGEHLVRLAAEHRDRVAVARTLTQHAVPTKMGLRFANWERGLRRATDRLCGASELPVQLGGAAGTMAAFLEIGGAEAAAALPAAFADELLLDAPDAPWHTARWPITELGDALVQVTDALGVIAADVATLSRTEIGELAEGGGGGSSAMPQKRNP
ncbi:MAG: adenylosuccinate lyase, partial [Actinobacteria bacterium]|nr:adenylosuccinate lyase [Actinomycetota bacterium]